jgi:hypothetical protein
VTTRYRKVKIFVGHEEDAIRLGCSFVMRDNKRARLIAYVTGHGQPALTPSIAENRVLPPTSPESSGSPAPRLVDRLKSFTGVTVKAVLLYAAFPQIPLRN